MLSWRGLWEHNILKGRKMKQSCLKKSGYFWRCCYSQSKFKSHHIHFLFHFHPPPPHFSPIIIKQSSEIFETLQFCFCSLQVVLIWVTVVKRGIVNFKPVKPPQIPGLLPCVIGTGSGEWDWVMLHCIRDLHLSKTFMGFRVFFMSSQSELWLVLVIHWIWQGTMKSHVQNPNYNFSKFVLFGIRSDEIFMKKIIWKCVILKNTNIFNIHKVNDR